jgi:hypothetical protein
MMWRHFLRNLLLSGLIVTTVIQGIITVVLFTHRRYVIANQFLITTLMLSVFIKITIENHGKKS